MPSKKPVAPHGAKPKNLPTPIGKKNTVNNTHRAEGRKKEELALQFVERLGLTEESLEHVTTAEDVTQAVLDQLAKVSLADIAQAFPPEVVRALSVPGATIRVKPALLPDLHKNASRTRVAAEASTKLQDMAILVGHSARQDADVLDEVVHDIVPQIDAQSAVDPSLTKTYQPVLAYWAKRFPGGKKKAKSKDQAPTPAK